MAEPATRDRTRLEAALRRRIDGGGRIFVPYVTGGLFGVDPNLLREVEATGANALEVGIPFSDPVMDGGVIQEASRRALEDGFHPRDAFALVAEARLSIPVAVMTYLNPVLAMGMERFTELAVEAGVAGVIVPDLPVDEGGEWAERCAQVGLATIYLAAPGTSVERLERVAKASTGWVYCVSTYGVTGERETLSGSSREVIEALRPRATRPLLAGVGISTPELAAEACTFADGVIVGSALVKPMLSGEFDVALDVAREFRRAIPE